VATHSNQKVIKGYKPSKKFFIKSPYPYLSKCTDPLKVNLLIECSKDSHFGFWNRHF
jgi:hypothetical protein